MTYLKVLWKHNVPDDPRWLYSEIDDERRERRKIEVFPDGRWGFADAHEAVGGSFLGEVATPSIDEVNLDPQFEAAEIAREVFEALWAARQRAVPRTDVPLVPLDPTATDTFIVALLPVDDAETSALNDDLGSKRGHAQLEVRQFVGPGDSPGAVAASLLRNLGLTPPPEWNALNADEARTLVTRLLARDLAYDAPTMPVPDAEALAGRVCACAPFSGSTLFFTNRAPAGPSSSSWHALTAATFDAGVLAIDGDRVGVFWVEDED